MRIINFSAAYGRFVTRLETKVKCSNNKFERLLPVKNKGMLEMNNIVVPLLQASRQPRLEDLLQFIELENTKTGFCDECKCPFVVDKSL